MTSRENVLDDYGERELRLFLSADAARWKWEGHALPDTAHEVMAFVPSRQIKFPRGTSDGLEPHRNRYGKMVIPAIPEQCARGLSNPRECMHPEGETSLTVAINPAEADHIVLYRDVRSAQDDVKASGCRIVPARLFPLSVCPIWERDRDRVFERGNCACVAAPGLEA